MRKNKLKKIFGFLIALTFLTTSCQKDNIVNIDPVMLDEADDDIANTTFTQTVNVEFSTDNDAVVSGTNEDFTVSVNGNHVTLIYTGEEYVLYELSGSATEGCFKLYSPIKQAITLNSIHLTNPNGAAINIQGPVVNPSKGKRTFIVLYGENTLSDGANYAEPSNNEDEKGTFFSEGQLIFSGSGSLKVNALGKSGIVSDDYVAIYGGTIDIAATSNAYYDSESAEYKSPAGIKTNDYFKIVAGSLNITHSGTGGKGISCDGNGFFMGGTTTVTTTGDNYGSMGGGGPLGNSSLASAKAIKFKGNLVISGGKIIASSTAHEGIEAKGTITVTGGEVYSYSQIDDGINSGSTFTIEDGYVYGQSEGNDGLDANGNFYIKGGVVYAITKPSYEVAIDANTEGGFKLYLEGGTLITLGNLEHGSSLTQNCYQTTSWSQNTWYALSTGSTTYAFKTPSNGGTPLVVSGSSTPTLTSGVTVSGGSSHFEGLLYQNATVSGGAPVSLSTYTGNNGGGPGPVPN